jgi:hypothetical protein
MHELLGAPMLAAYREDYEWSKDRARAQLGDGDFTAAWQQGRALTFDQVIEFALEDEPRAVSGGEAATPRAFSRRPAAN